MIPEFNEHEYLPPGIHPATLEEIDERFGQQSEVRIPGERVFLLRELPTRVGS